MRKILLFAIACCIFPHAQVLSAPEAEARDFAPFEFLLARSPFSLPTAEESSPLAERYALTGAVELDGRQQVFVLDRTSQQRHIVTKDGGTTEMVLLEFLPDPDPRRMRARVQIGTEAATIAFAEAPTGETGQNPQLQNPAQMGMHQPPTVTPGPPNSPPRRVIRRRFISATPQANSAGQQNIQPPAVKAAP